MSRNDQDITVFLDTYYKVSKYGARPGCYTLIYVTETE